MNKFHSVCAGALVALVVGTGAFAEDQAADGDALQAIEKCLSVEVSAARLACFEKAAAAFDFATAARLLNDAANLRAEADKAKALAAAEKARAAKLAETVAIAEAEAARLKAASDAKEAALAAEAAAEKARAEALAREAAEKEAAQQQLKVDEFGKRDAEVKTVDVIETTILKMRKPRTGRTVFMLANQQVWQQADSDQTGRLKPGMKVRVRKTKMGGYLMTIILNRKTVRVKRII